MSCLKFLLTLAATALTAPSAYCVSADEPPIAVSEELSGITSQIGEPARPQLTWPEQQKQLARLHARIQNALDAEARLARKKDSAQHPALATTTEYLREKWREQDRRDTAAVSQLSNGAIFRDLIRDEIAGGGQNDLRHR